MEPAPDGFIVGRDRHVDAQEASHGPWVLGDGPKGSPRGKPGEAIGKSEKPMGKDSKTDVLSTKTYVLLFFMGDFMKHRKFGQK